MRSNNIYRIIQVFLLAGASVLFFGCAKEKTLRPYELNIRSEFPDLSVPADNPLTEASVDLGRKLFYDTRLSVDSTISCASCHKSNQAFADDQPLSLGVKGRLSHRNSPTLTNIGYAPYFNFDGGVRKLEIQPNVPIEAENEMDFHVLRIQERLKTDQDYQSLSEEAYGRTLDPYVISRALASFMRIFISDQSRYDQYIYDGTDVLTADELTGMELFFGDKAKCSTCHSGFNFTDYSFKNNGYKSSFVDVGRFPISLDSNDLYRYRVPTLRNIELSAPYMHDGSVATLEEVLSVYGQGGSAPTVQDSIIRSISLTAEEQAHIIAFLKTLNDEDFINNPDLAE